jgi:hypothetical protein
MANGFNPYGMVGTQQNLIDTLLQQDQSQQLQDVGLREQKGEMVEDFEKDVIDAQKKQEEVLSRKRKKGWLEKLMPVVSLFAGPLAGGILSGLTGIVGLGKEKKHLKSQIGNLKGMPGFESKYGGTFLGSGARETQSEMDSLVTGMEQSYKDIGFDDFLMTGLTEGIKGYGTGKLGTSVKQGLGKSFAAQPSEGDLVKDILGDGKLGADITDIVKLQDTDPGFFKKLFTGLGEGLGTDPGILLKDNKGQDILKNILMMYSQMK